MTDYKSLSTSFHLSSFFSIVTNSQGYEKELTSSLSMSFKKKSLITIALLTPESPGKLFNSDA